MFQEFLLPCHLIHSMLTWMHNYIRVLNIRVIDLHVIGIRVTNRIMR